MPRSGQMITWSDKAAAQYAKLQRSLEPGVLASLQRCLHVLDRGNAQVHADRDGQSFDFLIGGKLQGALVCINKEYSLHT